MEKIVKLISKWEQNIKNATALKEMVEASGEDEKAPYYDGCIDTYSENIEALKWLVKEDSQENNDILIIED